MRRLSAFWRGFGSILNIWPERRSLEIDSPTADRSDADALRGDWEDWERVGQALERVGQAFQNAYNAKIMETKNDDESKK